MLSKRLKRILKSSPATKELIGYLEGLDEKVNSESSSNPSTPSQEGGNNSQSGIELDPLGIYGDINYNTKITVTYDTDDKIGKYMKDSINYFREFNGEIHIYDYIVKYKGFERNFSIENNDGTDINGFYYGVTENKDDELVFYLSFNKEEGFEFTVNGFELDDSYGEYMASEFPQELNINITEREPQVTTQ